MARERSEYKLPPRADGPRPGPPTHVLATDKYLMRQPFGIRIAPMKINKTPSSAFKLLRSSLLQSFYFIWKGLNLKPPAVAQCGLGVANDRRRRHRCGDKVRDQRLNVPTTRVILI
ncbi:hypothetical protein EVAR_92274_1 [Eumeta japonica]|uniref:Uncharacterized protein n=1 Tax=Eumeta variegata TaxID=151549 RepID=A0A4C1TL22_EUMVA|nr:hypothetical protein EVAR_92274_1 [Eumeta japonica]